MQSRGNVQNGVTVGAGELNFALIHSTDTRISRGIMDLGREGLMYMAFRTDEFCESSWHVEGATAASTLDSDGHDSNWPPH